MQSHPNGPIPPAPTRVLDRFADRHGAVGDHYGHSLIPLPTRQPLRRPATTTSPIDAPSGARGRRWRTTSQRSASICPVLRRRPSHEIDLPIVEAFIYSKLDEGKAPKSIRNYLGLLHSIFAHGIKRGWCESNPVASVDKPRDQRDRDIRFLTLAELEAVIQAIPDTPLGRVDRLVVLAAAMTGMRRGEVVAVRWHDVDEQAGLIRVRQTFTRGQFGSPKSRRSSRAVPLAPRLASELRAHRERTVHDRDDDLVFAHPELGTVLDPSKLRKRFRAAVRRAGVRPVRFHDLRHTFGTQMATAGAPMRAIQEWLGHSDLRTTLIYADYALDPNQGALYAERAFGRNRIEAGGGAEAGPG